MTRSDTERRIEKARVSFEAELHSAEFRRVHADDARLKLLLGFLAIAPGGTYLDLATGNGYVAFAIAGRGCRVTGLDVAAAVIETNTALARENGLANVAFEVTGGVALDLPAARPRLPGADRRNAAGHPGRLRHRGPGRRGGAPRGHPQRRLRQIGGRSVCFGLTGPRPAVRLVGMIRISHVDRPMLTAPC